jgi:hypothetical protein
MHPRTWTTGPALLISIFLSTLPVFARQSQKAPAKPGTSVPCEERIKAASESGWARGFLEAYKAPLAVLGDKDEPIPIRILAENIDGSDAYQYAAAQVIRTQFGDNFEMKPNANLTLYLSGTNTLGDSGSQTQEVVIRLEVVVSAPLRVGSKTQRLEGELVFDEKGGVVENYSTEERVQYVKEEVYAVLNEFIQHWESASQ